MGKSIEIYLGISEEELSALFSYSEALANSGLTSLEMYISYGFNQTMKRDGFFGSWAEVIKKESSYVLKLSSPHHDLSDYERLIPEYINAGKIALDIVRSKNIQSKNIRFLLPFGLTMASVKSVQLLHFPPLETFIYLNYLFSRTNRRWENLLVYNKLNGVDFNHLESIVDCVPLAAGGGDGKGIAPYNFDFTEYVKSMMRARLSEKNDQTQPVVAYGGPVREWLQQAYPDQIKDKLEVLSLVKLRIFGNQTITPVLCANHPSEYLYYTSKPFSKEKEEILTQDLIAAAWQARMAYYPDEDPYYVLESAKKFWTGNPKVLKIMNQEDSEFNFNSL